MNTLITRVEELSTAGIDIQVMTIVFRSEGYSDEEISEAYSAIANNDDFAPSLTNGLLSFSRI